MSVFINLLAAACLYYLCAFTVQLSYSTSRVFCFSHAAAISAAPYMTLIAVKTLNAPLWLAAFWGVVAGAVFGFGYQALVGRWMRHRGVAEWQQMLASLGYFVVVENILVLAFGDQPRVWLGYSSQHALTWAGTEVTLARYLIIGSAIVVALAGGVTLFRCSVGRSIRGAASSPDLLPLIGINPEHVRRTASLWSCTLAALVGVLASGDVDMTPGAGLPLFLAGMVAAIVAGVGSFGGLIVAAFFLAGCQQFAAVFLHSSWIDSAVYFGLILTLLAKPLGFSGRRLRKVEV
jgi:branched-subunit amino acid ABC-type transport system permease component